MGAMHCAIGTHQMTPAAIGPRCHWSVPAMACHWACHWDTPNGTLATSSCVSLGPALPPPLFATLPPCSRAIWCVPMAPVGTPPPLARSLAHPPVGTQWHAPAASAVDRRSPAPISVLVPLFRPKLALIGSSVRCVSDFRPSGLSSHAVLQRKSSFSLPWGHTTQKIGGIHRTEQPISATKRRKSGIEGR